MVTVPWWFTTWTSLGPLLGLPQSKDNRTVPRTTAVGTVLLLHKFFKTPLKCLKLKNNFIGSRTRKAVAALGAGGARSAVPRAPLATQQTAQSAPWARRWQRVPDRPKDQQCIVENYHGTKT